MTLSQQAEGGLSAAEGFNDSSNRPIPEQSMSIEVDSDHPSLAEDFSEEAITVEASEAISNSILQDMEPFLESFAYEFDTALRQRYESSQDSVPTNLSPD